MVSAAEQLAANLNFSALAKAQELKNRIWFTLVALLVYRLGTYIPLPGIDPSAWDRIFRSQAGGILGMFNMFSGGGIHRMAIFALNIMPYISASIIIQLMTTVFPELEALKKEGEAGRKVINQYTRYGTVGLAAIQAYGIAIGLEAMRMLEEGVASVADIDRAMELGYNHPMGPLRLTDLVGLDVRLAIAESLASTLGPRFEPPKLLRDMVADGKLGKKTGQGFYRWDED